MGKTITGIAALTHKRGNKREVFSFSGVEAQGRVDEIIADIKMTKENLEEYRAEASSSATQAASSADSASASAVASAASAKEAATSASESAVSATASADSATSASASETAAAESAALAKTYADKTSEVETTLAQAEETVTEAKKVADEIENKIQGADEAADKAVSAASTATSAATAAATSEKNAKASATAASSSETNAKASATSAATNAQACEEAKAYCTEAGDKAKTWAVGGTGTRDGEDTDNAKYYADLARQYEETAKKTDVGTLTELVNAVQKAEATVEKNLTAVNHDVNTYPAFVADRIANVTDLDNCTTNGIYQFTAEATNNPVGAIGMALVLNSTGSGETGYIAQYAWAGFDAHTVYARDDHNGTWGAWEQVGADGDEITSLLNRMTAAETAINASVKSVTLSGKTLTVTKTSGTSSVYTTQDTTYSAATTSTAGLMSAADKTKLNGISTGANAYTLPTATSSTLGGVKVGSNLNNNSDGTISLTKANVTSALGYTPATKVTVDDALSATSSNPVANKAVQSALDAIEENVNTKASSTDLSNLSKNVSTLATAVASKADKATTLAGYGITDGATTSALFDLSDIVDTKVDITDLSHLDDRVSDIATEVNARPSTRKLSTQTLTAEGGALTWTDSCITDTSLIDVYASIPNIAPSAITQSGTTVTVTFDAQDAAFSVAIVVM